MRIFDLARLALKGTKSRWTSLALLGMAVAAFCLCFAGAVFMKVQEEKSQPYELIAAAVGNESIDANTIADMLELPDVEVATPVLQLPVTLQTGDYYAQITLTGINADYLNGVISQGSLFPADSVMPYILLGESACKQFTENEKDAGKETPQIDWLNANYSLQIGEGGLSVTSKVCGILSDGDDTDAEPTAYISLSVAKLLLRQSDQPTDSNVVWLRITNIGCAQAVSRDIAALGLSVINPNEQQQAEWDAEMKEMVYLLAVAAFCLACCSVVLGAHRAIMQERQKETIEQLRWMGMRNGALSRMFQLHAGFISALGAVVGLIISNSLPSFLMAEEKGTSCYMLPIPFIVSAISLATCVLAGMISACFAKARQPSL